MGLSISSQTFFDNITDADGYISPDLKLEVDNCSAPYCKVRGDRPTCSNTYFENLPAGYEVIQILRPNEVCYLGVLLMLPQSLNSTAKFNAHSIMIQYENISLVGK